MEKSAVIESLFVRLGLNFTEYEKKYSEIIGLALIMTTIQIMDGILTGIGMHNFGLNLEGNLLIKNLMHQMGYVETLFIVKGFAILATIFLCYRSLQTKWISKALEGIISIYLFIVVIPWSFVLLKLID